MLRFLPLVILLAANQTDYSARYSVHKPDESDLEALEKCNAAWGESPFQDLADTPIRVISTQVRVMGIGGGEPNDDFATDYPQLVLIRPSVNVMTRTTYSLLNPNGWYCLHTSTTVMGAANIRLACGAHLANSSEGTSVMGLDDTKTAAGGVVVLGSVKVEIVGC